MVGMYFTLFLFALLMKVKLTGRCGLILIE